MIVGIDIGTQSIKAVVTTDSLEVLGEAAQGYAPVFPQPGWAEQNPALWEKGLPLVLEQALQNAGINASKVGAVGVAGQLDGCLPVGPDGRALSNCLIWMDRRALRELSRLADVDESDFRRITGITMDAGHMAAKIRWLMDHLPDSGKVFCFHQPVSYLVARLTGAHVLDHATASTSMLYSLERGDYDPRLLKAFGLTAASLPVIKPAWAEAGKLSPRAADRIGLPPGIPVAVGTGDDFSTPLGGGLIRPGQMACVLGTAEVVGALDESPRIDNRGLLETHRYFGGTYFIENPGWLSGGALEWFVETFRLDDAGQMVALAESAPPGSEGLLFLPALSGAMAPEWIASARAGFYGLTPAHGTAHMARAVLEGCAFAMRDVLDRLGQLGVPVESILLMGGGARSHLWSQIRSDVGQMPVTVPSRLDTSPVGAAMLAAVAADIQPDLQTCAECVEAAGAGAEAKTLLEPDPGNADLYDDAYARYRLLFDSLRPMF